MDSNILSSEPLEIKLGVIDIDDIDKLIINILQEYKELLELSYMRSV